MSTGGAAAARPMVMPTPMKKTAGRMKKRPTTARMAMTQPVMSMASSMICSVITHYRLCVPHSFRRLPVRGCNPGGLGSSGLLVVKVGAVVPHSLFSLLCLVLVCSVVFPMSLGFRAVTAGAFLLGDGLPGMLTSNRWFWPFALPVPWELPHS